MSKQDQELDVQVGEAARPADGIRIGARPPESGDDRVFMVIELSGRCDHVAMSPDVAMSIGEQLIKAATGSKPAVCQRVRAEVDVVVDDGDVVLSLSPVDGPTILLPGERTIVASVSATPIELSTRLMEEGMRRCSRRPCPPQRHLDMPFTPTLMRDGRCIVCGEFLVGGRA